MSTKLKRNPNVNTNVLPDGSVVLFCDRTSWAHTLSALGGIVWEFCDGQNSIDEIVDQVQGLEGVPEIPDLKEKVTALLLELTSSGLVETDWNEQTEEQFAS